MRVVVVDKDKCMGTGMCESLDPDRFEVGDGGQVILHEASVAPDQEEIAREAVESCPTEALRFES